MSYANRVTDTSISQVVTWLTATPDTAGASYPGPGTWGIDTQDYSASFVPDAGGAGGLGDIVWLDGGVTQGNVFGSWNDLYAAVSALPYGQRRVVIDNTYTTFPAIPAGTWLLDEWEFVGAVDWVPYLQINDGAVISLSPNRGISFESLYINVLSTSVPPITKLDDNGITVVTLRGRSGASGCWVDVTGGTQPFISAPAGVNPSVLLVINQGFRFVNSGTTPVIDIANTTLTTEIVLEGRADLYNADAIDSAVGTTVNLTLKDPAINYIAQTGMLGTVNVTRQASAAMVAADDTVAPVFGTTNVQGMIDAIKPLLGSAFVYAPGFTPSGNVFDTWSALHTAVNAAPIGLRKVIVVDEFGAATVPSGAWRMRGWDIEGRRTHGTYTSPTLRFMNGATLDTTPDSGVDSSWYDIKFTQLRVRFSGSSTWWTTLGTGRERLQFTGCRVLADGGATPINAADALNAATIFLRDTRVDGILVNTNTSGNIIYRMFDGSRLAPVTEGTGSLTCQYDDTCSFEDPAPTYSGTSFSREPLARRKFWVPAGHGATIAADVGANEVVVGGFAYQAFDDYPTFEALVATAAVSVVVKLYDIGPAGGLMTAPVLRSTITILGTNGYGTKALTRSTAPGVNLDEIYEDSARMYEVRVVANTVDSIYLYSTGLVVDQHLFAPGLA